MAIVILLLLLIGAVLAWGCHNAKTAKSISLVATLGAAGLSLGLLNTVMQGGAQMGSVGEGLLQLSWNVGIIEAFMACLFGVIGFLIVWASTSMIAHDVEEKKIPMFYGLVLALLSTLNAVVFFNGLLAVLIAIELSSFAAAGIVMVKNQPETLRAGLKYFSLSILGSSLVLMGMVILYTLTNTLNMGEIQRVLHAVGFMEDNVTLVLWALGLVTVGVAFKSALFPCHIWLPDAHGTAPSPSSAMLSSLVLKAYIVFYIKMVYQVIGIDLIAGTAVRSLMDVVMVVGVIAMICGSVLAIMQTDIKRMIAYSSVAQMGYIFMGIGIGTEASLFAALFHILTHAVTKSALFLNAGSIIEQTHNRRLDKMGGLGMLMPVTMAMFTVGGLSMIGIPLLVGFNSKWNFSMAIMDSGIYWLLIPLSISALLNALYYLPVVIRAFFGQEAKENANKIGSKERKLKEILPILVLTGFVILFGVWAEPVSQILLRGIQMLTLAS